MFVHWFELHHRFGWLLTIGLYKGFSIFDFYGGGGQEDFAIKSDSDFSKKKFSGPKCLQKKNPACLR